MYHFTKGSLLKITDFKTIIDSKITALHFLAANMVSILKPFSITSRRKDET
jgi:hypothetical protein